MLFSAITVTIFDNFLDSHTPNFFDSGFWTGFICIRLNLMCVRVSTHRPQVTNFSTAWTCHTLEFTIRFLVSLQQRTHVSGVRFLPVPVPVPWPVPLPLPGCLSTGTLNLSTLRWCPLVVATVGDRLWWEICRPEFERLAMPSELSTSSGFQAVADHVVTICWSSVAQLRVSSLTLVEASRPSWQTRATRLQTACLSANCIETLLWNSSRPSLDQTSALPGPAHVPFFVLFTRTITLARPAVFVASTAHSTFYPLSVGASVTTSTVTSAAVMFLVPARMSSITEAALRSSVDFSISCDIASTFSRSNWRHRHDWCCGDWPSSPVRSTSQHSSATMWSFSTKCISTDWWEVQMLWVAKGLKWMSHEDESTGVHCLEWQTLTTGQTVQRAGKYAGTQDELLLTWNSAPQITTCELGVDPLHNLKHRMFPKQITSSCTVGMSMMFCVVSPGSKSGDMQPSAAPSTRHVSQPASRIVKVVRVCSWDAAHFFQHKTVWQIWVHRSTCDACHQKAENIGHDPNGQAPGDVHERAMKTDHKQLDRCQPDEKRRDPTTPSLGCRSRVSKSSCLKGGKKFFWSWTDKEREGQRKSIKKPCLTRQFCGNAIRQTARESFIWKGRSSSVFQLQKRKL